MPEENYPRPGWLTNRRFQAVAAIILLGLLIYANTFNAAFHFDDMYHLVENPNFQGLRRLPALLKSWPTRAVAFFTFALNHQFHRLWLPGYHLVNLGLHLTTALILWQLVRVSFESPRLKDSPLAGRREMIALFAGLIFVSHPVQTQAVTYIYQRSTLLAALFYLLALLLYSRWRLAPTATRAGRLYYGALAAGLLGMFSKEICFTLPLALLLYDLFFFSDGWKGLPWKRLAPFLALLAVVPLTLWLGRPPTVQDIDRLTSTATPLAWRHYLYTQARVLLTYLRLLVLPVNQILDYDYPVLRRALAPGALAGWTALLLMLMAAGRLFRRERLLSFAIIFFLLALSVESSFIPLGDVIFEHRLYLPLAGFAVLLAAGLFRLAGRRALLAAGALGLIIFFNSGLAVARNRVWRTELSLWNDNVAKAPGKARPWLFLGIAYLNQGAPDRAAACLTQAIKLDNAYYYAYCNRGMAYNRLAQYDLALADFNRTLELKPDFADAYFNRGVTRQKQGDMEAAIADWEKTTAVNPKHFYAYNNLAVAFMLRRDYDRAWQAVEHLRRTGGPVKPELIRALNEASRPMGAPGLD